MSSKSPIFQREDLRKAYALLRSRTSSREEVHRAFKILLKSNVDLAQMVALEYFCGVEVLTRFGIENPYATFSTMLLGIARRQLQRPPVKNRGETGTNHVIALRTLHFLGDTEDIPLIEPFIRSSQNDNVLYEALTALDCCLDEEEGEIPQQAVAALTQIIVDEEVGRDIRANAISVFRNVKSLPLEIENLCLHIAEHDSPQDSRLPLYAAWVLGSTNVLKHKAFLEDLLATWPQDLALNLRSYLQDYLGNDDDDNGVF